MKWCKYHNQKCCYCGDCHFVNEAQEINGTNRKRYQRLLKRIHKDKYGTKEQK